MLATEQRVIWAAFITLFATIDTNQNKNVSYISMLFISIVTITTAAPILAIRVERIPAAESASRRISPCVLQTGTFLFCRPTLGKTLRYVARLREQ